MTPTRRSLLKGLALLPATVTPFAGAIPATGREQAVRFVVDRGLPGGAALADFAHRQGQALADPRGEIVALFLGPRADWLETPAALVGLTGYSDMVLMSDLARSAGRPMRFAAPWGERTAPFLDRLEGSSASFVAALRAAPAPRLARRTGSFLWLV